MNATNLIFLAFLCHCGWAAQDETSLLQVKQYVKHADGASRWADSLEGEEEQDEEDDTSRKSGPMAAFEAAFRRSTRSKLKAVESDTDVMALKTARDATDRKAWRRHDKNVNRQMRRLEDAQDKEQVEREMKNQNWLARMYGGSLGKEQAQVTNAHRTNKLHRKWARADMARSHRQENQGQRRKARENRQYLRQKQRAEHESQIEWNRNYGDARHKMGVESEEITRQIQADILDSETYAYGKAQGKMSRAGGSRERKKRRGKKKKGVKKIAKEVVKDAKKDAKKVEKQVTKQVKSDGGSSESGGSEAAEGETAQDVAAKIEVKAEKDAKAMAKQVDRDVVRIEMSAAKDGVKDVKEETTRVRNGEESDEEVKMEDQAKKAAAKEKDQGADDANKEKDQGNALKAEVAAVPGGEKAVQKALDADKLEMSGETRAAANTIMEDAKPGEAVPGDQKKAGKYMKDMEQYEVKKIVAADAAKSTDSSAAAKDARGDAVQIELDAADDKL